MFLICPPGLRADLIAVSPEGLPASFGDVAVRGEYTDILLTGLCQGDEIRLITDTAAGISDRSFRSL